MAKKLSQSNALNLLDVYNTQEGLNISKIVIDYNTDTAFVVGDKDEYQYTIIQQKLKFGKIATMTKFSKELSKDEKIEQIKQLKKDGLKQMDIANRLGVSQGLVSRYSRA